MKPNTKPLEPAKFIGNKVQRYPPGKSPIERLAAELLLMIASNIPKYSAAAFTITSKTIYENLGDTFLDLRRGS